MFFIPVHEILRAALIFMRIGGLLFALPVFGDQPVPVRARILLAVAMTAGLSAVVPPTWLTAMPTDIWLFAGLVCRELLIGLTFGYVARMAFEGVIMAATFVGYQMGFGTSAIFVPDANQQLPSFAAAHRIIVVLIFFALNLHHLFFHGIMETFQLLPAGAAGVKPATVQLMVHITSQIFFIALQLSAPVLVALMFATVALGLVSRAVPQLNVFTMSFPVGFFTGLIVYIATLPLYPGWVESHFMTQRELLRSLILSLR